MTELLQKIQDLAGLLQKKIAYYDKAIKEREAKLDAQDKDLVERAAKILSDETKLKPFGDLANLRELAIKEKKEADEVLKAVREEKAIFIKEARSREVAIEKTQDEARINQIKANDKLALAEREWASLRKEQAEYKAKFLEEIKNKVK